MTNTSSEQRLSELLKVEQKTRSEDIDMVLHRRKKVVLGAVLASLARLSQTRGAYAYFVECDARTLKQHFYVASKLTLESMVHDGGANFAIGKDFLWALLSDSIEVIHAFANVETPVLIRERENPLWPRFHVHMLQLAIRGENEALRIKINKLAKNGKKPDRDECVRGNDFYSLLLNRDKEGLERLIQDKHAPIKAVDVRIIDFMSYLGTLEAKLCWLKGIPVQIDSPLLPMRLMPVEPLDRYDEEYEFLKPDWVSPRQGMIGDIRRWLGAFKGASK